MGDFTSLKPNVKVYVGVVVLVGFAALAQSIHRLYIEPIGEQWFILAGLTLLTGSFTVKVPSINAHISVSETFVFASVLLFGPAAGAITVLLECLIINFWIKHGRPLHRILFNITAPAIAIWVSGHVFYLVAQIRPFSQQSTPLPGLFVPLLIFTALYFLLNSALVAVALGFERDTSPLHIWWNNFTWLSVNYFSGASVAALIVTYTKRIDISTLAIILPLLIVSYLTFRTAMGRVEDSNKHLAELNRLHLSTIETLAMAIDAKDQITHGHIRRVQTYAVRLAQHLGVTDDRLIKAVEASALLHDMGKLAIPEYILNKPGKLTESEFDIMKLHASAGADILSAIEFPYPVVPIVRHHHENWDGSGYPDSLRGTDIPIGARILAVVDCFDALTSDRPYRPRLDDEEALRILRSRRGSMYDPLVVDTFLTLYPSMCSTRTDRDTSERLSNRSVQSSHSPHRAKDLHHFDGISQSADEMLALFDLARDLAGRNSLPFTADILIRHIKRFVPFTVAVFYVFDDMRNELVARYSSGDHAGLTLDLTVPLGRHLSGWVAVNRRSVINSDASLDFGDVADSFSPALKSALSSPVVSKNRLLGVLSLYSSQVAGFTEKQRRLLDIFCDHTAIVFNRALLNGEPVPGHLDSLTLIKDSAELEQILLQVIRDGQRSSAVLLLVDCAGLQKLGETLGSPRCLEIVRNAASALRRHLGDTRALFWYRPYQFIGVLTDSSLVEASEISRNLSAHIAEILSANGLEESLVSTSMVPVARSGVAAAIKEMVIRVDQGQKPTSSGSTPRIH